MKTNNLKISYPNICKYWSSNNKLGPETYGPKSHKRVLWICVKCNKEFLRNIATQTISDGDCLECSYKKRGIKSSIPINNNSLLDKFPEICKEWSNKNNKQPNDYNYSSHIKVWWKCKQCQKEWFASITDRTRKNSRGCPNCRNSKGEIRISEFLKQNNICYKKEYRISECRYKRPLPFDFAVLNNKDELLYLIEYQGQQHYRNHFSWTKLKRASLSETKIRDKIKFDYCKQNNIPLLIIKYTEYNNIETTLHSWIQNL